MHDVIPDFSYTIQFSYELDAINLDIQFFPIFLESQEPHVLTKSQITWSIDFSCGIIFISNSLQILVGEFSMN